ncbi:MAG: hypothetical protein ACJ77K_06345 [Bacteroidia bacterium]
MKKITTYLFFLCTLMGGISKGQNFSYSIQKDSSIYSDLVSPTVLVSEQSLTNRNFHLHLPFSFNFCGTATDSVIIETNGFVVLDKQKQLAVVAYSNFRSRKDTNGLYVASIGYQVSGTAGSRILKIQFSNFAQHISSSSDFLNYQVWLYEGSNKAEIHTGANASFGNPVMMGIINRNMDSDDKAYLLSGNPSSPSGQIVTGDSEFVYINAAPAAGVIYTFTPTF